jgi:hypothetical protein
MRVSPSHVKLRRHSIRYVEIQKAKPHAGEESNFTPELW